jgi:acetolactate synthase I/II/III large subunit
MTGSEGTAGRFVADALAGAGVRVAYTVPGESFLPLLDGLAAAGIRVVAARHEGGAGFMATAHGALTGRPAAVLVTRAVGAANLSIALHAAHADSVPLIALVGQVDRAARGREAFQEADIVATFGGLCRWAREVRDVAALPGALDEALRKATPGRPTRAGWRPPPCWVRPGRPSRTPWW